MYIHTIPWVIAVVLAGCGASQPSPTPSPPSQQGPAADPATGVSARRTLTEAQCEAQHGTVVGDIGDGATRRADYLCPSGKPPLGNIAPAATGPIAIEGTVCCPP